MNVNPKRDWLQIVGQFGVVASLIFVGLQMKQDQEIALSAAYQARTATLIDFLVAISTDDVARSALMKGFDGERVAEFTAEERFAFQNLNSAGRELMQNSHYQYVQGYLDEEHWQSVRSLIERHLSNPNTRDGLLGDRVRPSFREAVMEIERDLRGEADH